MQSKGLVAGFFEKWFQHESQMTRVHDKKLSAVVLMNLLQSPQSSLPVELQTAYPKFMAQLATIVSGLPKAEEEKKKLEEELECSDDEDDEEDDEADYEDLSDIEDDANGAENDNDEDDDDGYEDYDDDDDDDDDDGLWMDEMTDEIFLETPLDPLNIYAMFLELVQQMPQKSPSVFELMSQAFSVDPGSKASLEKTISLSQQKLSAANNQNAKLSS